jgi:tetratricopeptide (TPR) repeat protein
MSTIQRFLRHITALAILILAPFHFNHRLLSTTHISIVLSLLSLATAEQLSAGKLRSLGENALMERDYAQASSYYRQAIELEPDNAVNYYKLYNVHKRQRLLVEALEDISNAVSVASQTEDGKKKLMEYREQKAKLLVGLGRCDEAIEEYKLMGNANNETAIRCAKFISEANQSLSKQDWESATLALKSALLYMSSPSDAPDLLFQLAQSQFHLRDFYGVISDTGKLLKAYPRHLEAYALRGEAYWKLNDVEMAGKHFREGLKLDPEHDGELIVFV